MKRASPKPPKAYSDFVTRFPMLEQAWELLSAAGNEGPLDERTRRLIRLAVAVGGLREGAIRSSVRKAAALGISRAEIEQVVTLAAGTLGLPSTVAVYSWIQALLPAPPPKSKR